MRESGRTRCLRDRGNNGLLLILDSAVAAQATTGRRRELVRSVAFRALLEHPRCQSAVHGRNCFR